MKIFPLTTDKHAGESVKPSIWANTKCAITTPNQIPAKYDNVYTKWMETVKYKTVTTLWHTRNKTEVIPLLQTHSSDLINGPLTRLLWDVILTAVLLGIHVFWDVTLRCSVTGYWHFTGSWCLHLQELLCCTPQSFKMSGTSHLITLHHSLETCAPKNTFITDSQSGTILIQMSSCLVLSYLYSSTDTNYSATKQFGTRNNTSHLYFGSAHIEFWLGH